jgi:hypothetical protein
MTRKAAVAGLFYPENPEELKGQIKRFFSKIKEKKIKNCGMISPHAGYIYSGQTAACSFSQLQKADTYIILGTNHATAENTISTDDFETPMGIVKNDSKFSELLLKNPIFAKDAQPYEHSIEAQLPFLKYMTKNPQIVPIAIATRDFSRIKEIARSIIKTAEKLKRKIYIISSSDFTHYGYGYGFAPFSPGEAEKRLEKLDKDAISFILRMDAEGFLKCAEKTTICGQGAIGAAIESCKMLGAKKASLLKYSNSAEISKSYDNVVGYASIIFI